MRLKLQSGIAIGVLVVSIVVGELVLGPTDRPTSVRHAGLGTTISTVSTSAPPPTRSAATATATATPTRRATSGQRSYLSLAGQRVIYAYAGVQPPKLLFDLIRRGEAAGVILFSSNISNRTQIRAQIKRMQLASAESPIHAPLLVLTDQEGGAVRRISGPPSMSEKQIGQTQNPGLAAGLSGIETAQNLTSVGINVNLAPVLDVYRQSGNFIDQYQRSYSSNPAVVARAGAAFIAAQQRNGVAVTAKHFPGLGAASQSQNTDLTPTVLNLTLPTLRSVDEAPYEAAIRAGVRLIMLSWATYPALDANHAAGLSSSVIQGELRHRLGFRGVTVTDGIDAGAILGVGSLAARSILAARAGADLILSAAPTPGLNSPSQGLDVLDALASAIATHRLSLRFAREAAKRVLALRLNP